jgi:hypothetical protein
MSILRFDQINESIKFETKYHKYNKNDIEDFVIELTDLGLVTYDYRVGLYELSDCSFNEMDITKIDDEDNGSDYRLAHTITLLKIVNGNNDDDLKLISDAAKALISIKNRNIKNITYIYTNLEVIDESSLNDDYDIEDEVPDIDEDQDELPYKSNYLTIDITILEHYEYKQLDDSTSLFLNFINKLSEDILLDNNHINSIVDNNLYIMLQTSDSRIFKPLLEMISYCTKVVEIKDKNSIESLFRNNGLDPIDYNVGDCSILAIEFNIPNNLKDITDKIDDKLDDNSNMCAYWGIGKYILIEDGDLEDSLDIIIEEFENSSYKSINIEKDRYYLFELK